MPFEGNIAIPEPSNVPRAPRTGSSRPDWPLAVIFSVGGLGLAIARRLGQRQRLLLVDRDAAALKLAGARLADEGHDVVVAAADVTEPAEVVQLARRVSDLGPLRVLAYVTGISPNGGDWQTIMKVNLVGAKLVERAFLPLAGEGTAALFVSSAAAHVPPVPSQATHNALADPLADDFLERLHAAESHDISSLGAYLLSKRGLNGMVRDQAWEWGQREARIVSLSPGPINSPMGRFENERSPIKAEQLKYMPLRREGTMLEIADAAEFLTSDRASYVTGTDLLVDGGSMTRRPPKLGNNPG